MPRVIIIGGGISGLATAHYLLEEDKDIDLLLVEGENCLGGTMGTERFEGFLFEKGPNGFLDNVPHSVNLSTEIGLGERLRRAAPTSKNRYIYKNNKLNILPTSPLAILRTPLLSLKGRLRIFLEFMQPRCPEGVEDSVAAFGRRRIGEEAMLTFLDPMITGIHAGDVESLSLRSAFPKMAQMEREYGSLVKALISKRKERAAARKRGEDVAEGAGPSGPGGELCSFPEGLQELVQTIHDRLGDRVRLGWKAASLQRNDNEYTVEGPAGEKETAQGVVLALPSYHAASLLASSEPETARALEAIPYAPIAVVCLGFRREQVMDPLDGFGFLIPRDQEKRLLGTIFVSSIFPEHAPEGMVSLRCMIGGARDPDMLNHSAEQLQEIVLEELRPILGIEGEPTIQRVYRWALRDPQYNLGHASRIEHIEKCMWNLPGLFMASNAYYGIGINDCVREGKRKARAVYEYFRTLPE